ncbi:MAG: hypothetical protein HYS13_01630 [Planctomycetia bacterium]|nr:hypothetical protein [Planctomycetia bacterium]
MPLTPEPHPEFRSSDLWRLLRAHPLRWLLPPVVCAALALGYALVKPKVWEATQTMMLRSDAMNAESAPGRFRNVDEMKITQETVMEVVRSPAVLRGALADVGPAANPAAAKNANWPAPQDVEDLADNVKLTPPRGAEFGKTEIFYLKVQDKDPKRAVALAAATTRRLLDGLNGLRKSRAQSLIEEFTKSVSLAEADLKTATAKLASLERQAGRDLGELRMLTQSATGDSDLRRTALSIDDELRQTRATLMGHQELFELLQSARKDERDLLAAPSRLLESQPALRRLKDGLIDAQIRTAQLLGSLTDEHPLVRDARQAEQEIRDSLQRELDIAIRGLEVEIDLANDRYTSLDKQKQEAVGRLSTLAGLRAEYAAVDAEVRHRTALAEDARRHLANAQASLAAAQSANLVTLVDSPVLSDKPVGPSRSMIVLSGLAAGLCIAFALFYLSLPSARPATAQGTPPQAPAAARVGGDRRAAAPERPPAQKPAAAPTVPVASVMAVGAGAGGVANRPETGWTYSIDVSAKSPK